MSVRVNLKETAHVYVCVESHFSCMYVFISPDIQHFGPKFPRVWQLRRLALGCHVGRGAAVLTPGEASYGLSKWTCGTTE